jgi:hypothetical protein
VRVYLPEEQDAPVVICSELPASEGASVTNVAEQLAAEVIHYYRLPAPVGWIEHHPPESTDVSMETFDPVSFSSYEGRESALHGRDSRNARRSDVEAHDAWHGRGACREGAVG